MKVAVTGSSGLVGRALVQHLGSQGHRVIRLVCRRPSADDEVLWYPEVDVAGLAGVDAVVHLVGETLAGRWSEHQKEAIRESRVVGTRTIAEGLAAMTGDRPRVLVSASNVSYYGDRGDQLLTESSSAGAGFLASVHRDTEQATEAAAQAGIRVAQLRYGVVQTPAGGVIAGLMPLFRLGLGFRTGDGTQYISWVSMPDLVRAVCHVLSTPELRGPVNVVAPNPVTNREAADILARVLHRPRLLTLPRLLARLIFGSGLVDEVFLASTRAMPDKLTSSGFVFEHPWLEVALREQLRS